MKMIDVNQVRNWLFNEIIALENNMDGFSEPEIRLREAEKIITLVKVIRAIEGYDEYQ